MRRNLNKCGACGGLGHNKRTCDATMFLELPRPPMKPAVIPTVAAYQCFEEQVQADMQEQTIELIRLVGVAMAKV